MNSGSILTVKTTISKANVVDQIGALLYAFGHLKDNDKLVDLSLGEPTADGQVPLTYKFYEEQEVKVFRHN